MREIDEVRITLLRMFRGVVQLPQEIIDEILKAFIIPWNAAIKVRAISRGYLLRRNPYNYMDNAAAKAFSYNVAEGSPTFESVGLRVSMYQRNYNMMMARWRYEADLVVQRALLSSCNITGGR